MTPDDAPPGMIWRETSPKIGVTHVFFSGTDAPKLLVGIAWGLVALGVGYELLFHVVLSRARMTGSVLGEQAFLLLMIAVGAALAYKWRLGGPSSSSLEVGSGGLRFSRGFWRNPLVVPIAEVRELGVADHEQTYSTARCDANWETARWVQVVVVTTRGTRHVVACFGESACAVFYARRVLEMLHELDARVASAPFR